MKTNFDLISSLLQRFDRFLSKAADVDPEKVRTQKRYRIITFFLHYINNFLCWLLGVDAQELRRRIRWQRQAGIPFDPKNFSSKKSPLRR
jgi:hypothetical protein